MVIKDKAECKRCGGTGLVPHPTIKYAWLDCDCKQSEEHYQPLKPEDFDFPCSDTWRGFYFEMYSGKDPGYIPPQPEIKTELPPDLSEKLDQINADLSGLKKRSHIHDQPKSGIKKTKYKGLEIGRA